MSRKFSVGLILITIISYGLIAIMAADELSSDLRAEAHELYKEGQFKEALEHFETLALEEKNDGENLSSDISMSLICMRRLQQTSKTDQFLKDVLEIHSNNWIAHWTAAKEIMNSSNYGYLVADEFVRGQNRGGGQYVDTRERDRTQAVQWLMRAEELIPDDIDNNDKAKFYEFFASTMKVDRNGNQSWKLQNLTNLNNLPDYQPGYHYGRSSPQGAPVEEDGSPVYYDIPETLELAENDGERWRWLLEQEVNAEPSRRGKIDFQFAVFARKQFGVRTLLNRGFQLPESSEDDDQTGTWELKSLQNEETISQLASGVKRLTLREDYQYIKTFIKLLETRKDSYGESAASQLAEIYEDRQQYPSAAQIWRKSLQRFGQSGRTNKQRRLDQIVDNWGQFEPISSQPAGQGATIDYRFRNGNHVEFEAYSLDVPSLLNDVKSYLKSSSGQINWQQTQIDNIGYRVVYQNEAKYRKEKVAEWTMDLAPRANHFDKRVTVATPLQKAGAYLLLAKMKNGNTSRIIIWLDNTAIVKKRIDGENLYFAADAITGEPIPNLQLEFFGWQQQRVPNTKRQFQVMVKQHAEKSDSNGLVTIKKELVPQNMNWLVTAKDKSGRFAFMGFHHVWYQGYQDQTFNQTKAYAVTDRPVYRPDQLVQFKFWMREADYEKKEQSRFKNQKFEIKINDPQGTEVYSQTISTDEFAGLSGEFKLPEDAKLGQYYLFVHHNRGVHGGIHFRVEEYKKPEFEVIVKTPDKPIELGDSIEATIQAKYYYGAPVTNAKLKFKVERSTHDTRWYPSTRWDWLYGNGYWWFAADYDWYPGFHRWGCIAPRPFWHHWSHEPPELVIDREVEIGEDGNFEFKIDTELAKLLHGDYDHEYKITAEVTDSSRRTIVGTGKILVAREPFKVFSWTDRGHYRVGDTITANFQARTVSGSGVSGSGKLQLFKVTYQDDQPVESVIQEWDLDTNESGYAEQKINAQQRGQYRLSYTLTSGDNSIEGGYLFVVRGDGFDGSDFQFNHLELITNKKTYQPGEEVELLINTNRIGSTVLLFIRPLSGVYQRKPQFIKLEGKSETVSINVAQADMPNFFIEAITIANGELHTAVQQIAVPPEDKVINVEIVSDEPSYLPGAEANVKVKLTDELGEPFTGSLVMSVYDRAVEYISGGSNVPEIKEFFWSWKRNHTPSTEHSLERNFNILLAKGERAMANIGAFGHEVADEESDAAEYGFKQDRSRSMRKGGMPMPAMSAAGEMADGLALGANAFGGGGGAFGDTDDSNIASPDSELVEPTIRENFADTAFWKANITTNEKGIANLKFQMPENLSAWKLRAWGLGHGTNVGEGISEVVTAKNLVVRLQAPRFFVEKDEVVLSAVVHNYLEKDKQVQVVIDLEGNCLELMAENDRQRTVTIAAGGETRVDWRVKSVAEGAAVVTMQALTDEESDAMKMEFPVFVHGFLKTESFSGVIRPEDENGKLVFSVPEERRPAESRLEIRYSPTLAGAMVDALPYLVEYPYGCTEQTLNRFVPTVITQGILKSMDLDLAAIQEKTTNLNAQELGDLQERSQQWKRFDRNPVFDITEVELMVKKGVQDLTAMQNSDGGWGWFSGYGEKSYPHTTAVVVHGLQQAQKNDIAIVDGIVNGGINWLKNYQLKQIELLVEGERHVKNPKRKKLYKTQASNIDALVYTVLIDADINDERMQKFLYRDRLKLSLYSQANLGLAFDLLGLDEQRDMIVRNIDQFVKVDEENQTAYIDLPNRTYWWYWYGSTIEANAHYLKLLSRVKPQDPKTSGLVKYILNNRKNGTYWTNTRDTAYCIEALAEYLLATDELNPDLKLELWVDGEKKKTVEVNKENLFTFDNSFSINGKELSSGEHVIELRKSGEGPLYHNAYLTYFSLEDFITKAGLEIKVQRKFYKLEQDKKASISVAGSRGQAVEQKKLKYDRIPLDNLATVQSGDLIEVELEIDSKNDYEYVIFEDLKAAGTESVEVQSGYTRGGLGAYVEFRDERVAFFMRTLARGKHSVSYRLRAEIPGQFSALPAKAYAMYAPELKANSDEMKIEITDIDQN